MQIIPHQCIVQDERLIYFRVRLLLSEDHQ